MNYSIFNSLFVETLSNGNIIRLPVSGGSMYPSLKESDVLRVKLASFLDVNVGDILAYLNFDTGKILVHRLVKKIKDSRGNIVLTMAEFGSSLYYDPPLNPNNCVIGKVFVIERGRKLINLETKWGKLNSKLRSFLLVNLPLVIAIQRKFIILIETSHLVSILVFKFLKKFFRNLRT